MTQPGHQDAIPEAPEPQFRTHIIIYEAPAPGGRTAVPVRISQDWTVVTGYAAPERVYALFGCAARWTRHVRQYSDREPGQAQQLKDGLVNAVSAWHNSAKERHGQPYDRKPTPLEDRTAVPWRLMIPAHYATELTVRASHLAWDIQLGLDPAPALQALLRTAESYRRPKDDDDPNGSQPKTKSQQKSKKAKPKSPETIVMDTKGELVELCRPLAERIRDNISSTGSRNLKEETTNKLVRSTLREIRGWYDRYVSAAGDLPEGDVKAKEQRTLQGDVTDSITRPTARLRAAACNIEQRRRGEKEGRPQELVSVLLEAAMDSTNTTAPQETPAQ